MNTYTVSKQSAPPLMTQTLEKTAKEHGAYLDDRRLDLGLKWSEVARDMERLHGEAVTADYLYKIKRGDSALARMSVDTREALRKVLRIDATTWEHETGLYSPASEAERLEKKAVHWADAASQVPIALLKAAELYGDDFPQLRDPKWQQFMVDFRFRDGRDNKKPIDWLEFARSLYNSGVEPRKN